MKRLVAALVAALSLSVLLAPIAEARPMPPINRILHQAPSAHATVYPVILSYLDDPQDVVTSYEYTQAMHLLSEAADWWELNTAENVVFSVQSSQVPLAYLSPRTPGTFSSGEARRAMEQLEIPDTPGSVVVFLTPGRGTLSTGGPSTTNKLNRYGLPQYTRRTSASYVMAPMYRRTNNATPWVHELGHTLGLQHANSLSNVINPTDLNIRYSDEMSVWSTSERASGAFGPPFTMLATEYGDLWDVMGPAPRLSAASRHILGVKRSGAALLDTDNPNTDVVLMLRSEIGASWEDGPDTIVLDTSDDGVYVTRIQRDITQFGDGAGISWNWSENLYVLGDSREVAPTLRRNTTYNLGLYSVTPLSSNTVRVTRN